MTAAEMFMTDVVGRPQRRSRTLAVPLALFGVSVLVTGCGSRNTFVPPPPPKVDVAQPLQKSVTLFIDLTHNPAAYITDHLDPRVHRYHLSTDKQHGAADTHSTQLFLKKLHNYR